MGRSPHVRIAGTVDYQGMRGSQEPAASYQKAGSEPTELASRALVGYLARVQGSLAVAPSVDVPVPAGPSAEIVDLAAFRARRSR